MSKLDRSLWRAATKIAETLQVQQHQRPLLTLPHMAWQQALHLWDRLIHQFTRWLCGLPTDADVSLNLLASELTVEGAAHG